MPEYLTPNMIAALRALVEATREDGVLTASEIGQSLDVRFTKGNYMGRRKIFGVGAAAASICRALERRGLAHWAFTERYGETVQGWKITEAGSAKLSEVRPTLST
jgi:hypothetical protein